MNKAELIEHLATEAGTTKRAAGLVLDALATATAKTLASSGSMVIPGIGKLSTSTSKARKGRNPRNGAEVDIPASVKVRLTTAKVLKDSLN